MIDFAKLYYGVFVEGKKGIVDIWKTIRGAFKRKKIYSNCITEIPQNIKIEIDSENRINELIGCVNVDMNGSTYTEVTNTSRYPASYNNVVGISPSNKYYVIFWYTGTGCIIYPIEWVFSGTTEPTPVSTRGRWFNTSDLFWYNYNSTTNEWEKENGGWTYPQAIVEKDSNNKWQFAKDSNGNDMIFNGAGFIGHHAFVYPRVKGLIPNGFNDDGSLKSELWERNQLLVRELETNVTNYGLMLQATHPYLNYSNKVYWQYSNEQNKFIHNQNSILFTELANYSVDSNKVVTDFTVRQPYEGAAEQTIYEKGIETE